MLFVGLMRHRRDLGRIHVGNELLDQRTGGLGITGMDFDQPLLAQPADAARITASGINPCSVQEMARATAAFMVGSSG